MNFKKSFLALVISFLLSNILTTVWYMLSDDANFVSFRREEINYFGLLTNHFVYALIFVYLFSFHYEKNRKKIRAFYFGLLMAALMFIPSGLVVRSIWTVEFNSIFVLNSIAHLIIGGIIGFALSIIYDFKNK